MSRIGTGYDIARPTGVCAETDRPITVGERYVAALIDSDDGLVRRDYALAAWEKGARPQPPDSLFGHWCATMPEPNALKKTLIEEHEITELFTQLEGATQDKRIAFRFVLALILMRKRVIRYEGKGADDHGRPTMLVRWARRLAGDADEIMTVIDPGMDERAVADAMDQIGAVIFWPERSGTTGGGGL